jgi:hypothetical protein
VTDEPVPVTASVQQPVTVRLEGETADRRYGRLVVSWLLPVFTAILSTVLCLTVSERNAQRGREARAELQRTQCAIVVAQDDNYRDVPPQTELGRRNAASMAQLRVALGCPGR